MYAYICIQCHKALDERLIEWNCFWQIVQFQCPKQRLACLDPDSHDLNTNIQRLTNLSLTIQSMMREEDNSII